MAALKLLLVVCGLACLLLPNRVNGDCQTAEMAKCTAAGSPDNADAYCKAQRAYINCLDAAGCDTAAAKKVLNAHCGAAQFLMSWPLYLTVLALTLKQIYTSM